MNPPLSLLFRYLRCDCFVSANRLNSVDEVRPAIYVIRLSLQSGYEIYFVGCTNLSTSVKCRIDGFVFSQPSLTGSVMDAITAFRRNPDFGNAAISAQNPVNTKWHRNKILQLRDVRQLC